MYIYSENLAAKATLWLWELRDLGALGAGLLLSLLALVWLGWFLLLVVTALFGFLNPSGGREHSRFHPLRRGVFLSQTADLRMEDSQVNRRKQKAAAKEKASTRQLMGIDGIDGYRLKTAHGDLAFFIIRPTNISVLSGESIAARIYAPMTVLRGIAELEMLCLNSRANFEDNKAFLKSRMETEDDPPSTACSSATRRSSIGCRRRPRPRASFSSLSDSDPTTEAATCSPMDTQPQIHSKST